MYFTLSHSLVGFPSASRNILQSAYSFLAYKNIAERADAYFMIWTMPRAAASEKLSAESNNTEFTGSLEYTSFMVLGALIPNAVMELYSLIPVLLFSSLSSSGHLNFFRHAY